MATTTQTSSRVLGDPSALERMLIGGEQQVTLIDPKLKQHLISTGYLQPGVSDAEALNTWNNVKSGLESISAFDYASKRAQTAGGDRSGYLEDFKQLKDYAQGAKSSTIAQTKDFGQGRLGSDYNALADMVAAFGGDTAALGRNKLISDAMSSNTDLANMLKSLRETGGLPTEADIAAGTTAANKLYAGQREALNQRFTDMNTEYSRRAAAMGRDVLDPILQAKLGTEKTRQSAVLSADEGAAAQQLAMNLPGQRLNYQQMLTEFQGGLAQQAFKNRAAILEMGSNLLGAERGYRLNAGGTTSTTSQQWDFGDYLSTGIGALGSIGSMGTKLFGAAPMSGGQQQPTQTLNPTPYGAGGITTPQQYGRTFSSAPYSLGVNTNVLPGWRNR